MQIRIREKNCTIDKVDSGMEILRVIESQKKSETSVQFSNVHDAPTFWSAGDRVMEDAFPGFFTVAREKSRPIRSSVIRFFSRYFIQCRNEKDEVIGMLKAVPVRREKGSELWDDGYTGAMARAIDDLRFFRRPNCLVGLAIAVRKDFQGRGWANSIISQMKTTAEESGFESIAIPLRPTGAESEEHFAEYCLSTRGDGMPLDPWLRLHVRNGAVIRNFCARSMQFHGTIEEWEEWTDMDFPESGAYDVPGGIAKLRIDRKADSGSYIEPNVWVTYDLNPKKGMWKWFFWRLRSCIAINTLRRPKSFPQPER